MSIASSCAAPASLETAPSEPAAERARRLDALRAELDRLDDAMHDVLMRRAQVVVEVGALGAKGRMPLRPGREASILQRLVARNWGALAPETVVRVWREVLAGSSAQQNKMRVVTGDMALAPLVCEHFGATMTAEPMTPEAAIAAVRDGAAAVAVLPMPAERERWWRSLTDEGPRVVARLPFWRRGGTEALVLGMAEPDPSGRDRSLIVAPEGAVDGTVLARDGGMALVEVDGFVRPGEMGGQVLGAYAVQMGERE